LASAAGAALLSRLPYAKRLELERRSASDRAAALAAYALALEAAGRLRGAAVPASDLRFPQDGKPYLDGGPHFSVSHSDACIACAASVDLDCGLDLETAGESADPDRRSRLLRWTATEAVMKAAGQGLRAAQQVELSADLRQGRLHGKDYWLRCIDLGATAVAHLAAARPVDDVRIERVLPMPGAPAP
jgi:phosphopantetheinyl transferase